MQPHVVETQDGYRLTVLHIFRADLGRDELVGPKGVVLLQHGQMMDGLSWFKTEYESLPSLLVKAGFDVYLGNDRGTKNSMRHKELDFRRDAKKFYDFSLSELGLHDAPANLNFVKTHSQGR